MPWDLQSNLQFRSASLSPGEIWPLSVAEAISVAHLRDGLLSHVRSELNQTLLTIPFSQRPSEELFKRPTHFSLGIDRCYSPLPRVQDPTGGESHRPWGQIWSVCVWSVFKYRDFLVPLWIENWFLCGWTGWVLMLYTCVASWRNTGHHRHTHTHLN